jgi:tetratricopeptide (TPR) repeat protein
MKLHLRRRLFLLSLLAALGLAGCGRMGDYAKVIEGNRLHERGDYQGAIVAYLAVGGSAFPATIDYDLANVYARMGEEGAAAELYARARKESLPREGASIVADSHFNEGVSLYERGRFKESWASFRACLRLIDPSTPIARDARRNLELAWRAWNKSGSSQPRTMTPSSQGQGGQDESELRLLRRLETGRWKPGGEAPPSSGEDY